MNSAWITEVKKGRQFIGRMARQCDSVDTVENLCLNHNIAVAGFTIRGSVTKATFGVYDQRQQVYITDQATRPFDILVCNGRFIRNRPGHQIRAWITLADNDGTVCGGRLFSETLVFEADIELQEMLGPMPPLAYDADTGLVSLQNGRSSA